MIDSKQDEAVKLEACPVCGGEARVEVFSGDLIIGEAPVWVCSNNRLLGGDCPDHDAYLSAEAWNAHTTPANLNDPDKQEALAGEGVARELLDQARALRDFVFDRTPGGEAASREGRRLRLLASDHVNRVEALRALPSNEALSGDVRSGEVETLRKALASLVLWADNVCRAHRLMPGHQKAVEAARAALAPPPQAQVE